MENEKVKQTKLPLAKKVEKPIVKSVEKPVVKKVEKPVAPVVVEEKKKRKKEKYPLLPERELRRQLRFIEKRALYRAKSIIGGAFALAFAIGAIMYFSWLSIFAILIAFEAIITSIIGLIKFKKKLVIYLIIGVGLSVAAIAISLIPLIAIIPRFADVIAIIQDAMTQLI